MRDVSMPGGSRSKGYTCSGTVDSSEADELQLPIYQGAHCTVAKAAVLLLEVMKIDRNCTNDLVDATCKLIRE